MLPKTQRLGSKEVEMVMLKGKTAYSGLFLLKFLSFSEENPQKSSQNQVRISVITPKKAFNTAVLRNSIRRKVYSALKSLVFSEVASKKAQLSPNEILLTCLVCNKKIIDAKKELIQAEIKQVFLKSGILA